MMTCQDDDAIDGIPDLPNIARPGIGQQRIHSLGRNGGDLTVIRGCGFLKEVVNQEGDIDFAIPQRGNGDADDLKPVKKNRAGTVDSKLPSVNPCWWPR